MVVRIPNLTALESIGIRLNIAWVEALLGKFPNISSHQHILPHFLVSDLKQSAAPSTYLPPDIHEKHNITISGPILLQIYRVEEIGLSNLSQIYKLEESKHGQRVREAVDEEQDPDSEPNAGKNLLDKHTCKLLLEDGAGRRCFGLEIKPIDKIYVGMKLGQKIVLKNTQIFRGTLLLKPTNLSLLEGHITQWNEGYMPDKLVEELRQKLFK